jgi:putative two-component system response regulator
MLDDKGSLHMKQQTIFVVDDNDTNLTVAAEALDEQYRVVTVPSAAKMLALLEKITPDLILLDVDMPGINGFEAIKRLKEHPSYTDIPVIFLTGLNDNTSEAKGIELGAVDFITKPFAKTVLLNRLKTHLNLDGLIRERTQQLQERTRQLFLLHNSIVTTLAELVESRDSNTGGHIDRTTAYLKILSEAMLDSGIYQDVTSRWNMEAFVSSARLHDLGKILVPDSILNKPGPLTAEEFTVMKLHPAEGKRIIGEMIERTGESDFLESALLTAAYHHEKWDGSGYPYGLKGEEIPLQGRVMAIVDVYDALTSERPYKKAFTSDEAFTVIEKDAGCHFDQIIVDVFKGVQKQIEAAKDSFKIR